MRLRFKTRWRGFHAGAEGEIPDGVANLLIRRRIAEEKRRSGRRMRRSKPFIDSAPDP